MRKWARLMYQPALPLKGDRMVTGSKEHIDISRRAAGEGIVLLKNEGGVLPLDAGRPLVMLGKASVDYVKGGGGSGDVSCAYIRSLYDGLKLRGASIYEPLVSFYRTEIDRQYAEGKTPGMTTEPEVPGELLEGAAGFSDTALLVINRFSGEGWDRNRAEDDPEGGDNPLAGDFYLFPNEKKLVEAATARFKNVIAVLNTGGVTDLRWIKDDTRISGALFIGQGGMEGGLAAADAILGNINPSGRLSDTFAGRLEDYPSTANFHESPDYVDYTEDIYVGYRYFETIPGAKDKVVYPFGYGLSYTTFGEETVAAKDCGDTVEFYVKITNTGSVKGRHVTAVYAGAPAGRLGKPARVLADFAKTAELLPGSSTVVTLTVRKKLLASYDDLGKVREAAYVLEAGEYDFYIGADVRTAKKADFRLILDHDEVTEQLSHRMVPAELKERMLSDGSFEKLPLGEHRDINENILERPGEKDMGALEPEVRATGRQRLRYIKDGAFSFDKVASGEKTLDEFAEQLTDEELIDILGGQPNTGVANVYGFGNRPEYGIPSAMGADGPAGVRLDADTGVYTTAFPCATTIACTWDREVAREVGRAGGEELKENNMCLWLTPAINIHRNPMCGRNFEYYSEDPYLTGRLAGAMVSGIQENNVGACIKHFACNNKETNRADSESRVSERALREIYLKAFELIVKEDRPYAVMSSYNAVNGERTSESRDLLTGILREEWGFDGMVTSDWWNRAEQYKEILAGNDLKMATGFPERVKKAMELGALGREDLLVCAKHILSVILKFD